MRRRTFLYSLISAAILISSCSGTKNVQQVNTGFGDSKEGATVYFTSDISPKGLVEIYKALGVKPEGRVAVKISTGESSKSNHLRPELIADLVHEVNGTLVECNTAYGGSRATTEAHRKAIKERGFEAVAPVDIMDAEEDIQIPVKDKSHIQYDIVGSHIKNYDFVINLAHFKGHAMGGFGGVLKNQSIGFASSAGKLYIHSAGRTTTKWLDDDQDGFLASTDPVVLDHACIDLVFNHKDTEGDTASPLQQRINRQHGLHILEHAEKIGLGGRKYMLKNIDKR